MEKLTEQMAALQTDLTAAVGQAEAEAAAAAQHAQIQQQELGALRTDCNAAVDDAKVRSVILSV